MIPRVIEITDLRSAEKEITAVGSDRIGIELMSPKAVTRAVKLPGVQPTAANIIKQEMLALGGEAATARGAINHSVKATDVLIFGNLKQISSLVKKLKAGCFGLPQIALAIEQSVERYAEVPRPIRVGSLSLVFGKRSYIMGILNITPDSFSDGGEHFDAETALSRAAEMMEQGADIIDVGGESTRPGAKPVGGKEEIQRIVPVIKALARRKIPVSVDTSKAATAQAALDAGADMVNDISALRRDRKMAVVVAKYKAPLCIMHMRGTPETMQKNPAYSDLMGEIIEHLSEGLAIAKKAGILHGKIMVDPGIGFGKKPEDNLEIIKRLKELKVLGCPILIGPSRKSFIGKILDLPVKERLEGTAAAVAAAIAKGADLVRVHDVKEMKRVVRIADAILRRE
jgi:dihydropteroate synthase